MCRIETSPLDARFVSVCARVHVCGRPVFNWLRMFCACAFGSLCEIRNRMHAFVERVLQHVIAVKMPAAAALRSTSPRFRRPLHTTVVHRGGSNDLPRRVTATASSDKLSPHIYKLARIKCARACVTYPICVQYNEAYTVALCVYSLCVCACV